MSYESIIGLEVHVQLKTATKMFCRCPNRFGAAANTLVCEVCLGYPGTLPVVNRQAVDQAIRLSLALGAEVRPKSTFARKNYFYPDLPKGYQISQFDCPLAENGSLMLSGQQSIRIQRLHLEEDAGKLLHEAPGGGSLPGISLVDLNRCGVPLLEIVSEPDLRSPQQAQEYLQILHQVLLYTGASDGNMEQGSMRCDANVSIRPMGEERLGTRSEVKNLNSFRHVAKAIEHEVHRQIRLVESGDKVVQETRSFDADRGCTQPLRSKEEAQDYRYFPEPDLPPLLVSSGRVENLRRQLPELPWQRRDRFQQDHGLSLEDSKVLTQQRPLADYFEAVVQQGADSFAAANWVKTEILRELKERNLSAPEAIAPERLADLLQLLRQEQVSSSAAKTILHEMWHCAETPEQLAKRLGLIQIGDPEALLRWGREALRNHPEQVTQYREGRQQLLGFFVGRVMQLSSGGANPKATQDMLQSILNEGES